MYIIARFFFSEMSKMKYIHASIISVALTFECTILVFTEDSANRSLRNANTSHQENVFKVVLVSFLRGTSTWK